MAPFKCEREVGIVNKLHTKYILYNVSTIRFPNSMVNYNMIFHIVASADGGT